MHKLHVLKRNCLFNVLPGRLIVSSWEKERKDRNKLDSVNKWICSLLLKGDNSVVPLHLSQELCPFKMNYAMCYRAQPHGHVHLTYVMSLSVETSWTKYMCTQTGKTSKHKHNHETLSQCTSAECSKWHWPSCVCHWLQSYVNTVNRDKLTRHSWSYSSYFSYINMWYEVCVGIIHIPVILSS